MCITCSGTACLQQAPESNHTNKVEHGNHLYCCPCFQKGKNPERKRVLFLVYFLPCVFATKCPIKINKMILIVTLNWVSCVLVQVDRNLGFIYVEFYFIFYFYNFDVRVVRGIPNSCFTRLEGHRESC